MAKYVGNPVEVDALSITEILSTLPDGSIECRLEDGSAFQATPAMTARMTPSVGDYVVTQADGYVYLNPKAVFERKYHVLPLPPTAQHLASDVLAADAAPAPASVEVPPVEVKSAAPAPVKAPVTPIPVTVQGQGTVSSPSHHAPAPTPPAPDPGTASIRASASKASASEKAASHAQDLRDDAKEEAEDAKSDAK